MEDANEIQVGGDHYKRAGDFQHWDLTANVGAMEYAATKYLSRWPHKGQALQDLRKAQHYITKLIEQNRRGVRPVAKDHISARELRDFQRASDIQPVTMHAIRLLCRWGSDSELLEEALRIVTKLADLVDARDNRRTP